MVIILTLSIVGHFTLSHFFGKACSPIFLGKVTDIIPGIPSGSRPNAYWSLILVYQSVICVWTGCGRHCNFALE